MPSPRSRFLSSPRHCHEKPPIPAAHKPWWIHKFSSEFPTIDQSTEEDLNVIKTQWAAYQVEVTTELQLLEQKAWLQHEFVN